MPGLVVIVRLIKGLILSLLFLGFFVAVFAFQACAVEINYRGDLLERYGAFNLKNDVLLNPDMALYSVSKGQNLQEVDFSLDLSNGKNKFFLKNRLNWQLEDKNISPRSVLSNYLDNAFLMLARSENVFITAGKENLIEGVGLSYNPSDFLSEGKPQDYTKTEEQRKQDREGNYLIRWENLWEDNSFSVTAAPAVNALSRENSGILFKRYSLIGDADVAASYFQSTRPGIGFNWSMVRGEALELHLEAGLRHGSIKKFIKKGQEVVPDSGVFIDEIFTPADYTRRIFLKALGGGHYTFANRGNLIAEYFYNSEGYDSSQWNEFMDLVEDNSAKYKNPPPGFSRDIFAGNLSLANAVMDYRYMRRNYVFFRFTQPDILSDSEIRASLLWNADDGSSVFMPSADYNLRDDLKIGLDVFFYDGSPTAEFGLTSWKDEFILSLEYFF